MPVKAAPRGGTAPTLGDVAKAAGVSPMTVSRVINADAKVRSATRERVEKAIRALHYAPNVAARTLAGTPSTRIALLFGNPSAGYLSELLFGTVLEAARSNVQLLLEKCDGAMDIAEVGARLARQSLDGAILPPPFCDSAELLAILRKARIAVALIAPGEPAGDSFAVMMDDAKAANDMTAHLIARGHSKIGFIVGNSNHAASAKRLQGYKLALKQAGIAFDAKLVAQGDFSYRSGYSAAIRLLNLSPRPTAIFASNDEMAAATIAAAGTKHLEVPDDLSVAGFDDTALATTIFPELTTVRQPVAEMAQAAVAMLTAENRSRRSGATGPRLASKLLPHLVIKRNSVAAAPG